MTDTLCEPVAQSLLGEVLDFSEDKGLVALMGTMCAGVTWRRRTLSMTGGSMTYSSRGTTGSSIMSSSGSALSGGVYSIK